MKLTLRSAIVAPASEMPMTSAGDAWKSPATTSPPETLDSDASGGQLGTAPWSELGPDGPAVAALTAALQHEPAARIRTRLHVLLVGLGEVIGTPS
jgi:hypothetical protein